MLKIKSYIASHRMTVGLAVIVVGLTLVVSVALSIAAGSSGVPAPRRQAASVPQAASPAITAQLSVLARPATAADALPAGIEGNPADWLQEQRAGANGALARRTRTGRHGTVYLIPSAAGVCMLDTAGSENLCATTAELEHGEAQEAILCSPSVPQGQIEIGGILPDGTSDAVVVLSTGAAEPLSVEGNTYIADFPRTGPLPTAIRWISANGTQHAAPTHVPASAATEACAAP
jgi:hypothetical protein